MLLKKSLPFEMNTTILVIILIILVIVVWNKNTDSERFKFSEDNKFSQYAIPLPRSDKSDLHYYSDPPEGYKFNY